MVRIYPSLIGGNLVCLENDIRVLESHCAGFHCDVMDFHFVPNQTLSPGMVNAIRAVTLKQLWVHLMVEEPDRYIERIDLKRNDIVSIHCEIKGDVSAVLADIKSRGLLASLAINPTTPLKVLIPLLPTVDHVLLMTVNPGFSGQPFIKDSYERLKTVVSWREERDLSFVIGVDGGINGENIGALVRDGVGDIAVASTIFGAADPVHALEDLQKTADLAQR